MARTYTFFCHNNGDNMRARSYAVLADGTVIRLCLPHLYGEAIRHRIPRCQAAREMYVLRQRSGTMLREDNNDAA